MITALVPADLGLDMPVPTVRTPTMRAPNDAFASATLIQPDSYGTYAPTSMSYVTQSMSIEAGESVLGTSPAEYRSAWFLFRPAITGSAAWSFNESVSDTANFWLGWYHIYKNSSDEFTKATSFAQLTEIAASTSYGVTQAFNAKAGGYYHVRIVQRNMQNWGVAPKFVLSAPAAAVLTAVPFDVTLDTPTPLLRASTMQAVPLDITLDVVPASSPEDAGEVIDAAPVVVLIDLPGEAAPLVELDIDTPIDLFTLDPRAPALSSIRVRLIAPADDAQVPTFRPQLQVYVERVENSLDDDVQVQVQVGPDLTAGPATLSTDVIGTVTAVATLIPAADVGTDPQQWRARLIVNGAAHDWTPARTFVVNPDTGHATIPVTWTVTTGSPTPHLWYVTPDSGTVGTTVTIIGQGMPDSPAPLLGGMAMPVVSHRQGVSTAAATTASRATLDAEHDEIVVLVPDGVPPPGAGLRVEGD